MKLNMSGFGAGGSKLNIDHLSENECERILGVLQRDFHLRSRERTRLRYVNKLLIRSIIVNL